MKISACIIMKDAAKDLTECLESLKNGVDEIIITDTGSSDNSVEIARRYTDKIFFFQWCDDFSAAKNYCLEQATGDWIVFLDADEYFTMETRGNLRRIATDMYMNGYGEAQIHGVNVDEDHVPLHKESYSNVRMFRNDPQRRWYAPVHEHLVYKGEEPQKSGVVPMEELCIYHTGHNPSRLPGKLQRNMRLLEKMEGTGEGKLKEYYMCGSYFVEGDYEKAIVYAKKAIEKGVYPVINAFAVWRVWFFSLDRLGRDKKEIESVLKQGIKAFPKMPDFYANYGNLLLSRKEYSQAWKYFQKAEKLMEECPKNHPGELQALYNSRDRLYHFMSETCMRLGKTDLAHHYAELEWEAQKEVLPEDYSGLIPPRSRLVLELACGDGSTGRIFRRIQPQCRYIGIEEDAVHRQEAERWLEAQAGTPRSVPIEGKDMGEVDCILCRDRALWGIRPNILRRYSEMLAPDGQMIFVLENGSYFRRLANLFAGRQDAFGASGLSPKGLVKIIERAGLSVFSMDRIGRSEDEAEEARPETKKLLGVLRTWCKEEGMEEPTDVVAHHYILRAVKQPLEKRMLIQTLMGEPVISGRVRVTEPQGFLQTIPGIFCQADSQGVDLAPNEQFPRRVLVRQQQRFQERAAALSQIDLMRRAGVLIVNEMDALPQGWEGESHHERNLDVIGAHALQVSTRALADALKPYHPHVAVFQNELKELPTPREYAEKGPLTIFFGGADREREWEEILPALNDIAGSYGERLRFRVLSNVEFYQALQSPHKEFIGNGAYYQGRLVPHGIYGAELHQADIVLLPLHDTERNRVKSDIRFIEAAGHGAAVLASPVVYGETVRDGETGFIFRDERDFREKLVRLIEDRETRLEMARAAYEYVRSERLLSQHYEERAAFYEEMLERREELDGELLRRLEK